MIVAITGATGFIGRRLVQQHLALNHQVRILSRNTQLTGFPSQVQIYVADLREQNQLLKDFVQGVDVIYHLAAELNDESCIWNVNVGGTRNLLEVACSNVGRWIQCSSTGVYGAGYNEFITEQAVLKPNNLYEKSKAEADRLVMEFSKLHGLPIIILRPSNVYGPEMPNQSLFQLISIINRGLFFYIGKKGAIVNYIHVENVVDALMACSEKSVHSISLTYIISDYCTIEELVEIICEVLGSSKLKLRFPEGLVRFITKHTDNLASMPLKQSRIDAVTNRVIYSSQLITEELGHKNRISMKEGFKELVSVWKKSHDH